MKTTIIKHTGLGNDVRVPIDHESPVQYAAEILARREYGRSGVATCVRQDSSAADGSSATYQAFIGKSNGNGVTGHNIWLHS